MAMAELSTVLGLLGITLWPNAHQPPFSCKLLTLHKQQLIRDQFYAETFGFVKLRQGSGKDWQGMARDGP